VIGSIVGIVVTVGGLVALAANVITLHAFLWMFLPCFLFISSFIAWKIFTPATSTQTLSLVDNNALPPPTLPETQRISGQTSSLGSAHSYAINLLTPVRMRVPMSCKDNKVSVSPAFPVPPEHLFGLIAKFQAPITNKHDLEVSAFVTAINMHKPNEFYRYAGIWLDHSALQKTLGVGASIDLVFLLHQYHEFYTYDPEGILSDTPYRFVAFMKGSEGCSVPEIDVKVELIGRRKNKVVFREEYEIAEIKADINYWNRLLPRNV